MVFVLSQAWDSCTHVLLGITTHIRLLNVDRLALITEAGFTQFCLLRTPVPTDIIYYLPPLHWVTFKNILLKHLSIWSELLFCIKISFNKMKSNHLWWPPIVQEEGSFEGNINDLYNTIQYNGRFHTRRRTNRLDGQIVWRSVFD